MRISIGCNKSIVRNSIDGLACSNDEKCFNCNDSTLILGYSIHPAELLWSEVCKNILLGNRACISQRIMEFSLAEALKMPFLVHSASSLSLKKHVFI